MFLYQFHVHTEYSKDSDLKLDKLYKYLKKNNIRGIAITDHDTIEGALKFKKKYGQEIHVIIGEEIMTSAGEIIGLFLNREIPKGLNPKETILEIKKQNGIVYIPHPVDNKRVKTCLKEKDIVDNINDIDLIEIFNGRCVKDKYNEKAFILNRKLQKASIWGSDAHTCYELQFNLISFDKEFIDKENIVNELKNAKLINKRSNISIHNYTKYVRIKKLVKEGKINEAFNVIYKRCRKKVF